MFRRKCRKPSSGEIKTPNETYYVNDIKAIHNIQTGKCTTFFLRCLYYSITLSIATCFRPQRIIIREQVSYNTAYVISSSGSKYQIMLHLQYHLLGGSINTAYEISSGSKYQIILRMKYYLQGASIR
jgi:hypothetical protein